MYKNLLLTFITAILFFGGQAHSATQRIGVVKVEASSQYPNDSSSYYPSNAIDGDAATAWLAARSERANKGEWIIFHFDGKPALDRLVITNGWTKSDVLWRINSRIDKARLTFSDGEEQSIQLADSKTPIAIGLNGKVTQWVKLTIEAIHAGKSWNTEAGITDVVFEGKHTQSEVLAKVEPPKGKVTSAATERSFLWSSVNSFLPNIGVVAVNDLYWQDQSEVARGTYDWDSAKQMCANLKINFNGLIMEGFHLPSQAEYEYLLKGKFHSQFKYHGDDGSYYWTRTKDYRDPEYVYSVKKKYEKNYEYGHTTRTKEPLHARCVSRGGYLVTNSAVKIAETMAQEKRTLASRLVLPERPASPVPAISTALIKGEFEPSEAFRKRVTTEQDRVGQKNTAAEEEYRNALIAWERRIAEAKNDNAHALATQGNGAEAYLPDTLSMAMAIKYGKPLIKSFDYDADALAFLVDVSSERGSYAGKVNVAVPLALAPEVKRLVSLGHLKPELEMFTQNGEVGIRSIRQLGDPAGFIVSTLWEFRKDNLEHLQELLTRYPDTSQTAKLQSRIDELQFKRAFNSADELASFLKQRPSSELAMQAKERIQELKQRETKKQAEDLEKQKRIAAARERESRLYNAAKNVGDKVCASMTTQGLFSSDTYEVSGYLEGKNGVRIQIRISNPRAIRSYNGANLYQGAIIWDHHNNWKACH